MSRQASVPRSPAPPVAERVFHKMRDMRKVPDEFEAMASTLSANPRWLLALHTFYMAPTPENSSALYQTLLDLSVRFAEHCATAEVKAERATPNPPEPDLFGAEFKDLPYQRQ